MELLTPFLVTWFVGVGVTLFTFWATSELSWWARTALRTLVLAATFTPGIAAGGHGAAVLPAIVVLVLGLSPDYYAQAAPMVLGAMPIAIVWGIMMFVALVWTALRRRD